MTGSSTHTTPAEPLQALAGGMLEGQVVVVTGTSRGIGVGIADSALREGARVLGVARGEPPRHLDHSPDYVHLRADLTSDHHSILLHALRTFGRVDALVNNAALYHNGPFCDDRDQDWDRMLDVNVTAPFRLSTTVARHWVETDQSGTILNVASVESDIGWFEPPQTMYATTKGALLGLTRAMSLDLARHGIRVLAIGPGAVDTGMSTSGGDEVARRIPLGGRLGTPAEIGDVAACLLSDAARYMTGEIVYVDGGFRVP